MKFDIIIIGAGPGGYVAAIKAAQEGKKVALVERGELGGVCLNWGCIPTKALLKSAQIYAHCRSAASYGVDIEGEVTPNMERIVARSRSVAEGMSKGIGFLMSKNGIELIKGHARLISSSSIEVEGAEYSASAIILATGARPREIASIPLDGTKVISSKEALLLERLPSTIAVVGSGAIGSEFAYLYSALGAQVTLLEAMPTIMPLEDEEVSKTMERAFRKMRTRVLTSTRVNSLSTTDQGCTLEIETKKGTETLEVEMVLSAVGIKSNIENLGLEQVGVKVANDKIVVDSHYQTSVKGIYAIGDIIATAALAHVASAEAIHCVEYICGHNPAPLDYSTIPSTIFTSPEVASVGLTEAAAKAQGLDYRVGRFPFTASGKAAAAGEKDGFVKLLISNGDQIIGAHAVGSNVAELIAEPTLAKAVGATASQIASTIHSHPSLSESIMEAAEAAMGKAIHL